jgi:ubiquinone/menaquinone biosynthesis C-methylase UbiE
VITLPTGDHTPGEYNLPISGRDANLKKLLRRFLYPIYNAVNHKFLARRYETDDFRPDLWLWGQRGNDYERHRARVAGFLPLNGCDVLVAGCGTARDIESWVRFKPRRIVGIDWFSYARAWSLWKQRYQKIAPKMEVDFAQADLAHMSDIPDASFDVVSSDAVFEHLKNLPEVLSEFHRVLKPGGVLYATFGPLWYGYGGDHVSGYDGLNTGYNHLLLNRLEYQQYLEGMGSHVHSEHDGRTWIEHDLFSRLTPRQYLTFLELAGFKRRFFSAMVDPLAIACLTHPDFDKSQVAKFDSLDLVISGMTIIYEK